MRAAERLSGMNESVIREMTRLALANDAVNLSQGYPDFAAPDVIKQAAVEAIRHDLNQYAITWGVPALRQAIADKVQRLYGLRADAQVNVTVTCGVTEAITAAMMATINPGDEVILLEPAHENFLPAVRFAGGVPVWYTLRAPHYQIDKDELRKLLTPRTRAILINTPHNPTGRVFSRLELQGVADLCQEFDLIAVTDEIYEHIIYDDAHHIPLATLSGMAERTILIGGLSKTFAITGWRLGYAVAPDDLSKALRTVHDYTTICAPTPLQYAAVAAMQLPDSYYQDMRAEYTRRRARMMAVLQAADLVAEPPQGAYYVMADFSGLGFPGDDRTFAHWLVTEGKVAVVPGSNFYGTHGIGQHAVRFAFPKRIETLDEAGARLQRALARIS